MSNFDWLKRFRKDEEGSIAVETVLIIPALFWTYLAMFSIFDTYREYSVNQKASYVIADMISRETTPIDDAYVDGTRSMLRYITAAPSDSDVSIRVSSIKYDEETDTYSIHWSERRGWVSDLTDGKVAKMADKLPIIADNTYITLVETWVKYDPPFDTGLEERIVENFVFTKPRYAPNVRFENSSSL